jgi:Gene product 88
MQTLLSIDTNAKTVKGQGKGYLTGILYLAPSNESGVINTCPFASKGCREACLFTAGRGAFANVREARIRKTRLFHEDREGFLLQLAKDIKALISKAKKKGLTPCVRLNGTSDIAWENEKIAGQNLMEIFKEISFYDYTKNKKRMRAFLDGGLPRNYSLTFSRSESNSHDAFDILRRGGNVAAVFKDVPAMYWNGTRPHPVVNGDDSDLRFLDPAGVVVGLKAKGKAKKDVSGFVLS